MPAENFIYVYITCRDVTEARKIAGHCVSERLAASANIFPVMESFYWWHGTVNAETESVLILKTVAEKFSTIEKEVRTLHSYECPCIVALPLTDGHQPYLDWIVEHTRRQ